MDFSPELIVNDSYWTFGFFAKKNGDIDYRQLKEDLEQVEYYIAAILLETADGEYFARLSQPSGYRWIFENIKDGSDDCSEHFEDFVSGEMFEKFAEHAPEIIERGFDALQTILETTPEELKKNGINESKVKSLVSMAPSIIKRMNTAFDKPILKK